MTLIYPASNLFHSLLSQAYVENFVDKKAEFKQVHREGLTIRFLEPNFLLTKLM
jgi:hypothetical protein